MNHEIKVSIITIFYNAEKYLKEFEKRFKKLISRSIETTTKSKIIEIIKINVLQDHCGLKYFSNFL